MSEHDWQKVDEYIEANLLGKDADLSGALERNAASSLPPIDVSPAQARLLGVLVRATSARRVLEVGTLGGFSTIELARALPSDGLVTTIEIDPSYAAVARDNLVSAGVADRVEVVVGPALDVLDEMLASPPEPFDFTFIDADKQRSPDYFERAVQLSHPGSLIVVDNVVREGGLADIEDGDEKLAANRRLLDWISQEDDIHATTIQTVGRKGWDGFMIAVVGEGEKRYS